jgi:hypothetical protein
MEHQDALQVLGIQAGHVTKDDIKNAYRKACSKFHPDKNPAGLETMKIVNLAYEALQNFEEGDFNTEERNVKDYGEVLHTALSAIIQLGLEIEICGLWIWVKGDTKSSKDTLKAAGYLWAPKKTSWYFRPNEHKSKMRANASWSMEKIREKYGSDKIEGKKHLQVRQQAA